MQTYGKQPQVADKRVGLCKFGEGLLHPIVEQIDKLYTNQGEQRDEVYEDELIEFIRSITNLLERMYETNNTNTYDAERILEAFRIGMGDVSMELDEIMKRKQEEEE